MSRFAADTPFTIGLEEELLLVEPETLGLAPVAGDVLAAMHVDEAAASHEVYAAQLELRSPPSSSANDAVEVLGALRAKAAEAGATLMGVGLHPTAAYGDAELVATDRYRRVEESMRGLIRRTPESALHVHVGMPDEETAIRAFNSVRSHLPLLQGLSANSPWWFGADSGLASARYAVVRAYPGRGIPGPLRDFAEWEAVSGAALAAGDLEDVSYLWWDVRLHPTHGTLEVRELDAQSSLEHIAALGALVRALAVEAHEAPARGALPSEALIWSAFRAARDGTSATILDDGVLRPLADVARDRVARLRSLAAGLGDDDALDGIEQILRSGCGAHRQRVAYARGGLSAMLRTLVEDTAAGTRKPRPDGLAAVRLDELGGASGGSPSGLGGAAADEDGEPRAVRSPTPDVG
jgi:carboxylate-amine ligase